MKLVKNSNIYFMRSTDFREVLRRNGYQVTFEHREELRKMFITCMPRPKYSQQHIPIIKLEIEYMGFYARGKGVETDIKHVIWWDAKFQVEKNLGKSGFLGGEFGWYYTPGKEVWEELFRLEENEELTEWLWVLAAELFERKTTYLSTSKALDLFKAHSPLVITQKTLKHLALFKGKLGAISFASRDMMEYFLAKELNKKNDNSGWLRKYISYDTLSYLIYDQIPMFEEAIPPIKAAKDRMVKALKYEEAANLRDAEKKFIADILRHYWPNLSSLNMEAIEALRKEYLARYGLEI